MSSSRHLGAALTALLVLAAACGCNDGAETTAATGTAPKTAPLGSTPASLRRQGPAPEPPPRSRPAKWSSEEVEGARRELAVRLEARLGPSFGCVVSGFGSAIPLVGVVRPGRAGSAREVIRRFDRRFAGPTSLLVQRERANTESEVDRAVAEIVASRPDELIAVQPLLRDEGRQCPQVLVAVHSQLAERASVREWLAGLRRTYPSRLLVVRTGEFGEPLRRDSEG